MGEASKNGTLFEDASDYAGKVGTRVGPGQINLAYTWNKELAYENGQLILGESTLLYNLPIMIGPGMNIHRTPYNGRNVEYFSEDPILSGFIGSAVVQGAQSKGCLVNIKHMGFNDQEANRSGVATFLMSRPRANSNSATSSRHSLQRAGPPRWKMSKRAQPITFTRQKAHAAS